jgi:hypothetical protein
LGASAIVVFVVACRGRAGAGEACRGNERLRCASKDRALVCESGRWRELACRGPGGCSRRGDDDDCDDAVAAAGDPCPVTPPVDFACSTDRSVAFVCREGRFALWRRCRGAEGCTIVGERRVSCDTTLGEVGDPCEKSGSYACSVDGGAMLQCSGTSLDVVSSCRGPDGCRFDRDSHKVDCDDGIAVEGDPCDRADRIACAVDLKSELVCEKSRYVRKRECRRSDCRVDGSALFCE